MKSLPGGRAAGAGDYLFVPTLDKGYESMKRIRKLVLPCTTLVALVALCCCAVGPDYQKPDATNLTPDQWRWKPAEPRDGAPKGQWWKVFNDPVLDGLEAMAVAGNQDLQAAVARVDEARATARISRSQFFPELSLDPMAKREHTSGDLPSPIPFHIPAANVTTISMPLDLSYEVDLWGRVRRSFESAKAQAEASAADYQNVLLTLTADVAVDYFLIRSLDREIDALRGTIDLRKESLRILNERFTTGTGAEIDVAQAKAEMESARADLADASRQRAETLHGLALLCGKAASSFEVAGQAASPSPVVIRPGLPSEVLERRPDVARAERTLASKNAQIGAAVAAYYPVVSLTGSTGFLSADATKLFNVETLVWSIGPNVSLPVFTGGRTAAQIKQAEASYREALAQYRQTVLTAFKEVEDSLAQIVFYDQQAEAEAAALTASRRAAQLARARYDAGSTSYLEVVDVERSMLDHQRKDALIAGQRFAADVRLIKAVGGGWQDRP